MKNTTFIDELSDALVALNKTLSDIALPSDKINKTNGLDSANKKHSCVHTMFDNLACRPSNTTPLTEPDEKSPTESCDSRINLEINKPKHYTSKSGRDVIDWCEDFGLMDNAYVMNIFKYLSRAGKKRDNSALQDAMKARVYLDRYISMLEKNID